MAPFHQLNATRHTIVGSNGAARSSQHRRLGLAQRGTSITPQARRSPALPVLPVATVASMELARY